MKGLICLITSLAVALQGAGFAQAAGRTETIDKFGETTTFEYDEASRPEKMIYDTGAYALYTYDGRSRIKAVEHKNSSGTLLRKETNTYDPASRITSRYEGPASGGVTTTFGYDDAGQLTSESSSGYSASYTYDANGNRTNRTVNGVSETYTVDDSDKLTSVTWSQGGNNYAKEYAYHYSGRVTGITYKTNGITTSTETLSWNKENRLISRGTDTYTYNGLNTRVAKSDGGGSFTYKRAGAHQTAPVLHDGAANYLPGISERRSGTTTFLHSGIKNGVLQTNTSQSNTATNRYDAFGNVLAATGTWKGPFGYGGKFGYQTDEADMQLLGDRYYDSTIGRFLSRDAAQDGRNWYSYGAGHHAPIGGADPTGRWVTLVVAGVVLIGGLVLLSCDLAPIGDTGRKNKIKKYDAFAEGDLETFQETSKVQGGLISQLRDVVASEARQSLVYGPVIESFTPLLKAIPYFNSYFSNGPRGRKMIERTVYDLDRGVSVFHYE